MTSDPIADLLTRVLNGYRARLPRVNIPHSRMKERVCGVLCDQGYVRAVDVETISGHKAIVVQLSYDAHQRPAMLGARRISRPGRRMYAGIDEFPKVRGGLGLSILSTSKGIFRDEDARLQKVGGELLCEVW